MASPPPWPPPLFEPVNFPWRRQVPEYSEGIGWWQDGHRRHNVKTHKHFIWPKDGKNGNTWGRWKDILHGTGPDIHIAISADKMDYMWNRQTRSRWSRHTNLDNRGPDTTLKYEFPWASRRGSSKCYDFRTRRYRRPHHGMWTDALWPEEPNNNVVYPYALRDIMGEWWQSAGGPNDF